MRLDQISELQIMLDDFGTPRVLAEIAKDCHFRSITSSHPYTSAQWARRAKAIAQLANSFDEEE